MGAKFTGSGIAPDEHTQLNLSLDYDGKRDRWNGYDPEDHQRIVEEYSKVDQVSSTSGLTLHRPLQPEWHHEILNDESSVKSAIFRENINRKLTNVLMCT